MNLDENIFRRIFDHLNEYTVYFIFRNVNKRIKDYVDKYLKTETSLGRMAGPFPTSPFSVPIHVSPTNTVPKDESDERRIIADLSWPLGSLVNDNISSDTYLG